ncbi:MAG: reductive dehalogenase, partial [Candidatus Nezhaarchaeales archaeon]
PYVIDKNVLKRFDSKNTITKRVSWDSSWQGFKRKYNESIFDVITKKKAGYSLMDFALADASWLLHRALKGGREITLHKVIADTIRLSWDEVKDKMRMEINDPNVLTLYVKKAAKIFGASLIGICKVNRDWVYADADLPEDYEYAIVMAIEMNPEVVETSPSAFAASATGIGYSKLTHLAVTMSRFIYNLGFKAIPSINDLALNIPLAIDAGLGELGRNGLLITPRYGPRIQLCKVFTNMPLIADKPIEFGVREFCKKCKLCAKHCEANAISMDDEPSFEIACKSNNPGALKWYVNAEKCYLFWCENAASCVTCIKVCPYSKVAA